MNSEELVRIVNAYFTTEAAGNPALLKCSLLGKYADKVAQRQKHMISAEMNRSGRE